MKNHEFDAFGDVIAAEATDKGQHAPRPAWLLRIGMFAFWLLAGIIVLARAIYFSPGWH